MVKYRLIDFDKDESEVIRLLNQNLTPRNNKEFFQWKYINYPGGKSTGAVAEVDNKIVAVVFYLPFNFYRNGKIINAARPISGCTAQDYRGRGIFKNIMKFCLESYKKDYKFLFANPNRFSHPEFMKMGWKEKTSYEYRVGIIFPWDTQNNLNLTSHSLPSISKEIKISHEYYLSGGTTDMLKWRYSDKRYKIKKIQTTDGENYIVFRLHKKASLKLIILCDYIGDENYINAAIKEVCRIERTCFIYFLKNEITAKINLLLSKRHKQAVITYLEEEPEIIHNIGFSLGDLEGTI
ncbi:GNAT family N-acetyltransferase [Gillisia hiemivivida]|uniref:GNAT family N-acetyltransferase n=1 Tax=Gillisia hiemivivida TaxID=291190 RepID=A0A5C6ZQ61_9FLAO|nr:GNAT family N-acetyltransferase [Gillisia hiemivivida]TXD92863.1 GNAT family N-acetyltransferase [Gillisia hiemivivida]